MKGRKGWTFRQPRRIGYGKAPIAGNMGNDSLSDPLGRRRDRAFGEGKRISWNVQGGDIVTKDAGRLTSYKSGDLDV